MQTEAGDHVRTALLSVVPQHLGVVPGEESFQLGSALGQARRGDPATARGRLLAGTEFGDGQGGRASARRAYASATAEPGTGMGPLLQVSRSRAVKVSLTLPKIAEM
ncbi:hypothetical protein SHKM778_30530 [Streptomyces sp. KM77-8]|uniref:Uncharacterized protein n=1 Tax=Streptomyces haneummycinicus TaxID=3074435 RepID=A0AAT9HH65_9ACTN